MFNEEYILDLLSGQLTQKGYANLVGSIAFMVRHYQWQKNIIVSGNLDTIWTDDDVTELAQQFFEWIIANDKLKYIEKVPYEYLSYYFKQMLLSFVANRIKEEQQKVGISYQKCQELVKSICEESYTVSKIDQIEYVGNNSTEEEIISDISDIVKFLPKYVVKPTTKHYKPLVKMVIDDVMADVKKNLSIDLLAHTVFNLLDQSSLGDVYEMKDVINEEVYDEEQYDSYIKQILDGLTNLEAKIMLEYIFQDGGKVSLADLSAKYDIPKSSLNKKVNDFKMKIFTTYTPENEFDGECFIKKLAYSLDEMVK